MKYTLEELQGKTVHSLRVIGRKIGVKAPSSLTKSVLIENILKVKSGIIQPYFAKRGRPSLDNAKIESKQKNKKAEIEKEVDKILEQAKERIITLIKQKTTL